MEMEAIPSFSHCSKENVPAPVVSLRAVKVKIIGPKPPSQGFHPPTSDLDCALTMISVERFAEDEQLVDKNGIRKAVIEAQGSTCDSSLKVQVSNSDGEGLPILQVCDDGASTLCSKHSLALYHDGNKRKPSTSPSETPKVAKKRRTNSAMAENSWITKSLVDPLPKTCVPDNSYNALTRTRTARQIRRFAKKTPIFPLSSEEIEHDFRLIMGQQRLRKLAKRPKKVQENIKNLFPGMDLTELKD